jgi:hypothetical protein
MSDKGFVTPYRRLPHRSPLYLPRSPEQDETRQAFLLPLLPHWLTFFLSLSLRSRMTTLSQQPSCGNIDSHVAVAAVHPVQGTTRHISHPTLPSPPPFLSSLLTDPDYPQ